MTTTVPDKPPTSQHRPEPPHVHHLIAPARPATVRVVREALVAWLVGAGDAEELVDDVRVLASEVVTNAIVHTGVHVVAVEATIGCDRVFVAVQDDDPQGRPYLRCARAEDTTGRGLFLVQELSDSWGVTWAGGLRPTHKRVWFEVRAARRGSA